MSEQAYQIGGVSRNTWCRVGRFLGTEFPRLRRFSWMSETMTPHLDENPTLLLTRAEEGFYLAKASGGNRAMAEFKL